MDGQQSAIPQLLSPDLDAHAVLSSLATMHVERAAMHAWMCEADASGSQETSDGSVAYLAHPRRNSVPPISPAQNDVSLTASNIAALQTLIRMQQFGAHSTGTGSGVVVTLPELHTQPNMHG